MDNGVGRVNQGGLRRIPGDIPAARTGDVGEGAPVAPPPALRRGGSVWGERGVRVLPANFPLEWLDRSAPRGTYIDVLV